MEVARRQSKPKADENEEEVRPAPHRVAGYRGQGKLQRRRVGIFEILGAAEGERIGKMKLGSAEETSCGITAHTEVIGKKSRQKDGMVGRKFRDPAGPVEATWRCQLVVAFSQRRHHFLGRPRGHGQGQGQAEALAALGPGFNGKTTAFSAAIGTPAGVPRSAGQALVWGVIPVPASLPTCCSK